MRWIIKVNGQKVLTTGKADTATDRALYLYLRSDRKDKVQIYSHGPLGQTLVEEWTAESGGKEDR